jgi:glycosyltransferase involved in cell wall biosynthesis
LLRAYAKVGPERGIYLVVAGEHRWLCEEELALVDRLGISPWIVFPGWIEHDDLPAFYSLAEALVMPSLYEACPSPILESMSSGCPVVTSNRYGTLELSGNAAVLVDPDDIESIAEGMRRIMDERDLRLHLIEAGRERARSFTWAKCAQETLRVLEDTTAGG